jgi:hypothetical protein
MPPVLFPSPSLVSTIFNIHSFTSLAGSTLSNPSLSPGHTVSSLSHTRIASAPTTRSSYSTAALATGLADIEAVDTSTSFRRIHSSGIAGIVIGLLVFISVMGLGVHVFRRRRTQPAAETPATVNSKPHPPALAVSYVPPRQPPSRAPSRIPSRTQSSKSTTQSGKRTLPKFDLSQVSLPSPPSLPPLPSLSSLPYMSRRANSPPPVRGSDKALLNVDTPNLKSAWSEPASPISPQPGNVFGLGVRARLQQYMQRALGTPISDNYGHTARRVDTHWR